MTDSRLSTVVTQVALRVDSVAARLSTEVAQVPLRLDTAAVAARLSTEVAQTAVRLTNPAPGPVSAVTLAQDITGRALVISFAAPTTGNVNGYEVRLTTTDENGDPVVGPWVDVGYQRPTRVACELRTAYVVDVRAYGYGGTSAHVTATITTGQIGRDIITAAGAGSYVVPARVTSLDVIAIAGGGGAGRSRNGAGGGGAGGVKRLPSITVIGGQVIPYVVGAGGAGATGSTANEIGTNGADTVFGTFLTAHGGGAGQGNPGPTAPGLSGGSGGASSGNSSDPCGAGGAGTAGEGNNGGVGKGGIIVNSRSGGGGGGAGGPGLNGTGGASPGNGGPGVDTSSWVGGPYLPELPNGHRNLGVSGWVGGGGAGGRTSTAGGATGVGGQGGGGNNNDSGDTAVGFAGRDGTGGGGGAGGANGSIGASGFGGTGGTGLLVITWDQPVAPITPDPPVNVRLLDLQPTSGVLAWDPAPDQNVPAVRYEVRLDAGPAYGSDTAATHYFGGLVSQVAYSFSVRAVAADGNVSAWVTVDATTPKIPGDWEVPLTGTLRLEVEADPEPGQLVNLVQNPNGEWGAFGWVTPVAGSALSSVIVADPAHGGDLTRALRFTPAPGVGNYVATEALPCEPGAYAAASWRVLPGPGMHRARFEYMDLDQNIIATETPTGYLSADSMTHAYGPNAIPLGTSYLRLRLDLYADGTGTVPGGGDRLDFREATVVTAATAGELGSARANMLLNPSWETGTINWGGTGAVTFANDGSTMVHGGSSMRMVNAAPTTTRDNYVVNPSFETDTFGWLGGSGMTLGLVSYEHWHGSNSLRSLNNTDGVGTVNGAWTFTARQYDWVVPCTPGQRLYVRARMMVTNSGQHWDHPYIAVGMMFNVGGTPLQTFYLAAWKQDMVRGIWHDVSGSVVVPAGATAGRVAVRFMEWPNALHGGNLHGFVDAVQVTTEPVDYFDGSSPNSPTVTHSWLGAPYVSQSRQTTRYDTSDAGLYQHVDAIGGRYYTGTVYARADQPVPLYARLLFRNLAGTVLAAPVVAISGGLSGAWGRYGFTYAAPAGTRDLQVWFYVPTLNPTTTVWFDAAQLEVGQAATDFLVGSVSTVDLGFIPPKIWVNVLGQTHQISVTRRALDVGTLQADIIDPDLDPAIDPAPLLRPGHGVRLMAPNESATDWSPIFTGTASEVVVDYVPADFDERKRVRITLNAVDNVQRLANQTRPETVSAISELPATLEGCGVPWKINGSGDQVAAYTVAAANESASALDQVAIVRDSHHGYAFVDRHGVFVAWDAASLGATPRGLLLDETVYSSVQPGYDSDVLINQVDVKVLRLKAATTDSPASSEEVVFGPYRDEASIRRWGVRKAEFTIAGLGEDPGTIAAFGAAVLAGNGTPAVSLNNMRLKVDVTQDWSAVQDSSWYAWLDLYDLVTVTCERADIVEAELRVTEIRHTITAPDNQWMLDLGFTGDARVAVPTIAPPIPRAPAASESFAQTFSYGFTPASLAREAPEQQALGAGRATVDKWGMNATALTLHNQTFDGAVLTYGVFDQMKDARVWLTTSTGARMEAIVTGPSTPGSTGTRTFPITPTLVQGASPIDKAQITIAIFARIPKGRLP